MDEEIKKPEPSSELEELKKKSEEYLNNWKRAAADMINYKREEMERMAILGSWAKESVILKVMPIFDSFYLAEKQVPEELKQNGWSAGFTQIQNQISEFLKKEGIEEIVTVGQKFDPSAMETVEEVEASGAPTPAESDMVVEEIQKGYKIGDKVLRSAKVKISK